nr:hypothetical protein [Tanacetum cinerariifolium]
TMFLNVEQLEKQLDKEDFQEIGSIAAFNLGERHMQTTEEKVETSKALDASSVNTKSSRTESKEQDTSNISRNDAHDDDADIKPIYDEEPMAENDMVFHTEKTGMMKLVVEIEYVGKITDVVDKNDMVIHTEKTGIMRLVVEIEYDGKIADVFDKATCSFDGLQPEQVDRKYVDALNEPHFHDIRVFPNKHKVDQHFSCADPLLI